MGTNRVQIGNLVGKSARLSFFEEFLSRLGFSTDLMRALNEAEKNFRDSASPFELKNCLTHFRGFVEHLHLEAAQHIAKTTPGSTHDWGTATSFLRKHDFITTQQEKFARGIYALISCIPSCPHGSSLGFFAMSSSNMAYVLVDHEWEGCEPDHALKLSVVPPIPPRDGLEADFWPRIMSG